MSINTINIRRDIVTNKKYDKKELIRIAITKDGTTSIDKEYKLEGRGIYIHKDQIKKILENKILERHIKTFKGSLEQIKDELLKM